jgi:hypothetical protein
MPKRGGSKGDVPGQKARWRVRCRERAKTDPAYGQKWREKRRQQKARARSRALGETEVRQWEFPAKSFCQTCGGAVEDGQLYCHKIQCDPRIYRKRRERRGGK